MYKAVFIDMDGTLLRKDHTISEANKNALQQLLSRNILVSIVSARPLHGILPITTGIISNDMPIVSLNGSYIVHHNEVIYDVAVGLQDTKDVYDEAMPFDVSPMFYTRMEWFTTVDNELIRKEQKITPVQIITQSFEETLASWKASSSGPNKIMFAGSESNILMAEQQLLKKFGGRLNIYKSQPRFLEVMNIEASKAKAIAFLLKRHGIDRSEAIAIGDNYNDKEMIEYAGKGIAMGNAPQDIQMVADYVTDTNNNDGVAKALQHFFNL